MMQVSSSLPCASRAASKRFTAAPLRHPALRRIPRCTLNRGPRDHDLAGFERRPAARGRVAIEHLYDLVQADRRGRPTHPVAIHVPARWSDGSSLALSN